MNGQERVPNFLSFGWIILLIFRFLFFNLDFGLVLASSHDLFPPHPWLHEDIRETMA